MRPGGDTPLERGRGSHDSDHAAALQRNGVRFFLIAWRMTASLRATATRAFLKPTLPAIRRPQIFSDGKAVLLVSKVVAAS